jgi:hypothetical protein
MDTEELTLMEARVAQARTLIAEARTLGEDTADVEALVAKLESLLAELRRENGEPTGPGKIN